MSSLDPARGSRSNQPLIASWHRPRTWEQKALPWRTHIRNFTVFCFLVFLASPIIQGAGEPAWTEVAIDRGVTVSSRDRLGRVLPELLPLAEGRVRIPNSEIYFLLKRVDADSIEIEYGLDVDPRGVLPKWMVRRTARNTLIDTILALEAQVARTRGQYQFEIKALAEELQ